MQIILTAYYRLLIWTDICDRVVDSNLMQRCVSLLCDAICVFICKSI